MQSGLDSTSGENYGRWVRSRNWVGFALARPMVASPGTGMQYSTGTSHVLSAILTKATGRSTHAYAQQALATPLGFTLARWPRDAQGIYFGGNEMLLTPAQMVAVGELWRNRGRVGARQVVPEPWVDASCRPRTRSVWDPTREPTDSAGGSRTSAANARALPGDSAGSTSWSSRPSTSSSLPRRRTTASDERHGHRAALFDLITREVLTPLALPHCGVRSIGGRTARKSSSNRRAHSPSRYCTRS